MFRLPQEQALIKRLGFNNEGLEAFVANVRRARFRSQGRILGLNIGKNADTPLTSAVDDYVACLRGFQAVADPLRRGVHDLPQDRRVRAAQRPTDRPNRQPRITQPTDLHPLLERQPIRHPDAPTLEINTLVQPPYESAPSAVIMQTGLARPAGLW